MNSVRRSRSWSTHLPRVDQPDRRQPWLSRLLCRAPLRFGGRTHEAAPVGAATSTHRDARSHPCQFMTAQQAKEQLLEVGLLVTLTQFFQRAGIEDAAAVHDRDPIAQPLDFAHDVRRKDQAFARSPGASE